MSSATYNIASTFVDAQGSREFVGGLDINAAQLFTTPYTNNHLSPYQANPSNAASPPAHAYNTPGNSSSDYGTYQASDFEDQFFGVDFDADLPRSDSLPSNLTTAAQYQPPDLNRPLPDLPPYVERTISETFSASTYLLSPIHTSIPNTPSPVATNDLQSKTTISSHELNYGLYNTRFQNPDSVAPTNNSALQLTPDQSGSSHTSAEDLEPSTMAGFNRSPQGTIAQRGHVYAQNQSSPLVPSGAAQLINQDVLHALRGPVLRAEDGSWMLNEKTGQAGLDPESRRGLPDEELPTLDKQEERRRIATKNIEVQEWRSQARGGSEAEDEQPSLSYFAANNQNWYQQSGYRHHQDPEEDDNHVPPVDDAASIRENRLLDGQVYYDTKNPTLNQVDLQLINQPRQWYDAPAVPFILTTTFQPPTSNDAIQKFRQNAETMSIASRAATWGTRRRSEPNLADFDAVQDGSFLKKLTIIRPTFERTRQGSLFDQGLDRLANIVRKRSDSRLKRSISSQNIPEEGQVSLATRHNSQGTLAPPPRTSSFGKRSTPSINTTLAAMAGPLAAVGNAHARSGSISATASSPKSPSHLGWPSRVINRARSKSDLTATKGNADETGLVRLWRGHGGPPVPTLASPPVELEVKQPQTHDWSDDEDDDDDEDEAQDEGDLEAESTEGAHPIVPNYEGFKAHVRRLNPDMESRYNWLVSRIAHQQEIRYKNLLDIRVKHQQATANRNCSAGRHCVALGGSATLLDAKGHPKDAAQSGPTLHLVTDFFDDDEDDSNPGESALTEDAFPQGVPIPPTKNLPAELECQLCFKAKKFQKPSDWTKHVHEDVQPFTCTYDKCKEPKSFKRKADWVRHENERHRHLEWWICQVEDCKHPCYRKDNFLKHLVREHKLPEPKQKSKAAIKKARLTEPAWRMLEQCHHETTNRPQDEPCKFCGKSFQTWKKLTVHLAKHMEHISLPILKLVEARNVDANTIISPVEQILTPSTPNVRAKMESTNPFNMNNISPHAPMNAPFPSAFGLQHFFPTASPDTVFNLQQPMSQEIYNPDLYSDHSTFGVSQMEQRGLGSLDAGNIGHNIHSRAFGSPDSGYSQPSMGQARGYGAMDTNFLPQVPQQIFNSNQNPAFTMAQDFPSTPTAVSNYQPTNVLGIHNTGFGGYNQLAVGPAHGFPVQQVPMSRGPGSNSSYGHPTQNSPFYP